MPQGVFGETGRCRADRTQAMAFQVAEAIEQVKQPEIGPVSHAVARKIAPLEILVDTTDKTDRFRPSAVTVFILDAEGRYFDAFAMMAHRDGAMLDTSGDDFWKQGHNLPPDAPMLPDRSHGPVRR